MDDGGFNRRETADDYSIAWCEECDLPQRECQCEHEPIEIEYDYRGDMPEDYRF